MLSSHQRLNTWAMFFATRPLQAEMIQRRLLHLLPVWQVLDA